MKDELAGLLLGGNPPERQIDEWTAEAQREVLAHSRDIVAANFQAIHTRDLEVLFDAYDRRFFGGLFRKSLDGPIYFGLSGRMTKRAGRTAKFVTPPNSVHYEITISVSLLFDAFRGNDREVAVVGQVCENRLQALQRVFEHEMVHLGEFLCWSASDCAAERFQGIASRFFRHRTHTHSLITRRERAAESGIQRGALVTFEFEGRRLTGRVNRVTKRAAVLVPDANGQKYSDGFLYKKYYVPLSTLKPVEVRAAGA